MKCEIVMNFVNNCYENTALLYTFLAGGAELSKQNVTRIFCKTTGRRFQIYKLENTHEVTFKHAKNDVISRIYKKWNITVHCEENNFSAYSAVITLYFFSV